MHYEIDDKSAVRIGRIVSVVVGCSGLLVAINPPDAILWILASGFSVMAGSFTFPLLFGLWSYKTTNAAGIVGMVVGFLATVFWYVLGYVQYGNLNDAIFGIWPCIFGSTVSLVVLLIVNRISKPSNEEALNIFFDDVGA